MLKVEMVRCTVISPNPNALNPESGMEQVRYVPTDIYRLWKFLMVSVKGFQLTDELRSFWVDEQQYSKEMNRYGKHTTEAVVQIHFRYFKNVDGGRPVIRYFPADYYDQIIQYFMRNFSPDYIGDDTRRTEGRFVLRD